MEAVLLSTPIPFLKVKEESGKKSAKIFLKLKQNIDKPLSAILSLNTVAHTVGAAGVGAEATRIFGEASFGIVSAVLTILILVLSEIIPKTIGARYWRKLALVSAQIIFWMIIVTYPLVIISEFITKLFSKNKDDQKTSREEISAMADIGTQEGIFEEKQNKIIQNLIRLKSIKAMEIMTPRVVVAMANENMSLNDFAKGKEFLHYSRIPVYSVNIDNISGYILRKNVFEKLTEGNSHLTLKDIIREIVAVPETIQLLDIWEILLQKKEHIALIIDEYGGMAGIVTLEDIIETLLGLEIVDEKDSIADMQQYARERWHNRKIKYDNIKE